MVKTKLAEGKTKIIWQGKRANEVLIQSKEDITAGDGERRHILINKGIFATETTCNVFRLLRAYLPTHFIQRAGFRTFRACKCNMIPIEFVARRITTSSYLERHSYHKEGMRLESLALEMFFKDNALRDPLMIWIAGKNKFELYDAHKPISKDSYVKEIGSEVNNLPVYSEVIGGLLCQTATVFAALESAWWKQNIVLVDLKIEFGYLVGGDNIVLADVVDNDSWRIWMLEDGSYKMMDKEVYRQNYIWVADATKKFVKNSV